MKMIKCATLCGLYIICSAYSPVGVRALSNVSRSVELEDDGTNRLICARICRTVISRGYFISKSGHCQCLQHGGDELWTRAIRSSYMGCYRDDLDRVLPYGFMRDRRHLTTETCMHHCHNFNFIYFGTEVGNECHCGNVIKAGYPKRPEKDCREPCAGDRGVTCGAHFRISIYKINALDAITII